MKKHHAYPLAMVALMCASCGQTTPRLDNLQDTLSWAMGEQIALELQNFDTAAIDYELVSQAIVHTMQHGRRLNDNQLREAVQRAANMQQSPEGKEVDRLQEQYFHQLQSERPQVQKHPSGFYYEIVSEGKGRKPIYGERVSFDYRSFLMLSGEPWDQTYGKRAPILHTVGKPMFQGLIDGMLLMPEGSIFRFYFPYQTAFGSQGSGDIQPYTPFIYEVELHKVYDD